MRAIPLKEVIPNFFAGLIVGLVTLVFSISSTALIFSGDLAPYFPQGVAFSLLGATLIAAIVALGSSLPFMIAGSDSKSAVLIGLMAGPIAERLQAANETARILPTVWATIMISTFVTGVFLFIVGQLRLGNLTRFIPYPVIGGFLAGTGWLIARSSFKVIVDLPLEFGNIPQLMQPDAVVRWVPGVIFALVLLGLLRRLKHFLALPGSLMTAIVLFNAVWWPIAWLNPDRLKVQDWFFALPAGNQLWQALNFQTLSQADWLAPVTQYPGILMSVVMVVFFTALLDTTGIEIATQRDVNLDQELRINGLANIITGACGGSVGNTSISRSLLNQKAGATHPLSGVFAGGVSAVVLLAGAAFLSFFPKPIFGGLLLYLGLTLLIEWVYLAWFKLPRLDYGLVLFILVVIAIWGFIQGIAAGIAVACFLFIYNYSRNQVIKHALSGATHHSNVERPYAQQQLLRKEGHSIYILCLQGFVFFGTANALLETIRQRIHDPNQAQVQFLILDFRLVNGVDSSAVFSFTKIRQLAQKAGVHFILTALPPIMHQQLQQGGCLTQDESEYHLLPDLDRGVEWCEEQILEKQAWHRKQSLPLALQLDELFSDTEQVQPFVHYLDRLRMSEGEWLFRQGDPPGSIYFIETGQLTILLELDDGRNKRLQTLGAGTSLGEISFYLNTSRTASVIIDEPTTLYGLSKESWEKMQQEAPKAAIAFQEFLIRRMGTRMSSLTQELKDLLQ